MNSINKFLAGLLLVSGLAFVGCDKTKLYDVKEADPQAHFIDTKQINYAVRGSGPISPLTIPVGTTDVSDKDRNITVNISSPTGAVLGTQYTVSTTTVTIPAGAARASFDIQGLLPGYPAGRVDTLVITLAEPDVKPAGFLNELRIAMGDICSEDSPFNLNDLLGNYDNTNETLGTSPYGPYTTSISSVTPTSATSAVIVVENIFDDGWGPISFNLDWSDPNNKTATTVATAPVTGSDAGSLNSAYAGMNVAVRQPTGSQYAGTFSSCDQTFTLKMQLGVYDPSTGSVLGYFGVPAALYTVTMER